MPELPKARTPQEAAAMIADYLDRGNPNSPPNVCISSANAVGSFITIFLNGYQIVLRVEEACQS